MDSNRTVKSCPGIINFLRTGLIVPLWSDFALKNEKNGWQYKFADNQSSLNEHKNSSKFFNDFFAIKIHSPWHLKTKDYNVKFLFCNPFYHNHNP